ncbi:MAG: Ser-Thr-rich GPI-anchored membrane family protein [bacterium]|nr:Ser-Thr-rich GPI-anchored membrane family protein [bacterium]
MNYKKIVFLSFVSLLVACGFLFVSNAKATTTDELLALIQKLQQQVADLQKQLGMAQQSQVKPAAWCHDFSKNMTAGAKNEEVSALHIVLEKEGFDIFEEEKTNQEFDESTASAVSGFQQKYADEILKPLGLKYSTGILGKSTRAKLNKLFGCGVKTTPRPFCSPMAAICEANTKIICPAGLDDKGCPFPCKCAPVFCAQDIKTCSDGTAVPRIAPSCEFAPCPEQTTNQAPIIYGVGGPTFLKINETGNWTIKASDPEKKVLIYSVAWGDETEKTARQLSPQSTNYVQAAALSHSYSKAGVYNPTFTVADEAGLEAKASISVKVEETISPLVITEQVKCLFVGATTEQKCLSASDGYFGYACSGQEACVIDIKGKQGDKITWKSSCGGYAYTTMDRQNEYAKFDCSQTPTPVPMATPAPAAITPSTPTETTVPSKSITVITPNGGETLLKGTTYPIKWNSSNVDSVYIKLRKGSDTYYGPEGEVSKVIANAGIFLWTIPQALPDGDDYGIRIVDGTAVALDDSDALFSITATSPVTGYALPLNQVANILEAAQATIIKISQEINNLLKNR